MWKTLSGRRGFVTFQIASFPFVRSIHWRSDGSGGLSRFFNGHVSCGVVDSIGVRLVTPSKAAAAQTASRSWGFIAVESFFIRFLAACWRWWDSWWVIGGGDVDFDGSFDGSVSERRSWVAVMPKIVCIRNGC